MVVGFLAVRGPESRVKQTITMAIKREKRENKLLKVFAIQVSQERNFRE